MKTYESEEHMITDSYMGKSKARMPEVMFNANMKQKKKRTSNLLNNNSVFIPASQPKVKSDIFDNVSLFMRVFPSDLM